MASVQRKLVHKQFNSPIGLYSDQNVKETLDRELRAFNGNVGIDLNDTSRAPLNLINSSVLKMVAEEDYEKTHPAPRDTTGRQSRPRQRHPITREDVLKINRRKPRRRDISWPPSHDRSRSRSSSEEIHFDERVLKRHEIFHLKETFDRGPIDEFATANKRNNSADEIGSRQDVRSPIGNRGETRDVEFNAECQSANRRQAPWPPRSQSADTESDNVEFSKKSFYLPENELHIGSIEPIRAYWRHISGRSSSSPSPRSLSPAQLSRDELKRWRSHDNITASFSRTNSSSQLAGQAEHNSHKKDNLPLERNKSNSYNELPPLKPRRDDRKDVLHTKKKLNLNNSKQAARKMWDAGCWVHDGVARPNTQQKQQCQVTTTYRAQQEGSRCNTPNPKDELNQKTNQDKHFASNYQPNHLQRSKSVITQSAVEYGQTIADLRGCNSKSDLIVTSDANFAPMMHQNDDKRKETLDFRTYHENTSVVPSKAQSNANYSINKDSSLGRIGAQNIPVLNSSQSLSHGKFSSQSNDSLLVHTKRKDESPEPGNLQNQQSQKSEPNVCQERTHISPHTDKKYNSSPEQDMPFDRGGRYKSPDQQTSRINETAETLLLKRSLVQEAITQDIQRIDEYMKRAEHEAFIGGQYANESIAITPLQAILKQIVLPKSFILASDSGRPSTPKIPHFDPAAIAMVMQVENMPVVDEVLLELVALSRTLEEFEKTSSACLNEAQITEIPEDGTDEATRSDMASTPKDSRRGSNSGAERDIEEDTSDLAVDSSTSSRTASGTPVDKIIHSRNILSGYLITRHSQEELFKSSLLDNTDTEMSCSGEDQDEPFQLTLSSCKVPQTIFTVEAQPELTDNYNFPGRTSSSANTFDPSKCDTRTIDSYMAITAANEADINNEHALAGKTTCNELLKSERIPVKGHPLSDRKTPSDEYASLPDRTFTVDQAKAINCKLGTWEQSASSCEKSAQYERMLSKYPWRAKRSLVRQSSDGDVPASYSISSDQASRNDPTDSSHIMPWRRAHRAYSQDDHHEPRSDKLENTEITVSSYSADAYNNSRQSSQDAADRNQKNTDGRSTEGHTNHHRSRTRTRWSLNPDSQFRSSSQPSSWLEYPLPPSPPVRQHSLDSSESRFFASPRLYMSGQFGPGKGYKRVAWPPVDTAPIYATVPQPQNPPPSLYEVNSQARQKSVPTNYYQSPQYQQQHQSKPLHQQPQYQQNNYQQPQPQYQSNSPSQPQAYYQSQYQQPQLQPQQPQHQSPRYDTSPARQTYLAPQSQQPSYDSASAQAPSSTVSFAGGIARSVSPSRPIAREYTPGRINIPGRYQEPEQARQPEQYQRQNQYQQQDQYQLQQYQPQNQYQSPNQPQARNQSQPPMQSKLSAHNGYEPVSPQSGGSYASSAQSIPQGTAYPGWSPVRPPTPSRIGYTIQGSYPQYQRTNSAPRGSEPPYGAYQSSQNEYQPQATQAFQPVNHQPPAQGYQGQGYQAQSYSPQQQQQQQQQHYTQPQSQASPYARGQSPGVIQLRKEPPISQRPAPVYTSQPATTTFQGGSNMRGDLKWPPPEYKAQAAEANEERRRIAMGPVCRPRRVAKDYSSFFAKNALNHYYPGYKIPPGTQHMYTQY